MLSERFEPRFEWLYFLVDHIKPGVVSLNGHHFPACGVLWPEQQAEPHRDTASIAMPMENRALLTLLVNQTSAMAALALIHDDKPTLLKVERGRLVAATMTDGVGDRWSETVTTTGDVAAYLRQLGRMEIV